MCQTTHVGVFPGSRSDNRRDGAGPQPLLASILFGLPAMVVICFGCGNSPVVPTPNPGPTPNPFENLVGPYLGQSPPGDSFAQFAPGVVPGDILHGPTVSPDGREVYWAARDGIKVTTMTADGHWTIPQPVSFGGRPSTSGEDAPVLSPDNQTLYFTLLTHTGRTGWSFRYSERTASGWSEPRPLPDVINSTGGTHWQVSVSNSGTLCFGVASGSGDGIYCSRSAGGTYATPEPVQAANDLGDVICPFIAPDESYLLFSRVVSGRSGGHYVCFKGRDDRWLAPQRLDRFPPNENTSFVSRDGRYVFCRCYWASARIIEDLRPAGW